MSHSIWLWIAFNVFILIMLAIDLGVFHRKAHAIGAKEALMWSLIWISMGLAFGVGVYLWMGPEKGIEYLTGYIIEKSLSLDNMFVFVMIFTFMAVPAAFQQRTLLWGILGALIMRAVMIFSGVALLTHFHWMIYVLGIFLIVTGIRMFFHEDKEIHPEKNPLVKLARRFFPVTTDYEGARFFLKKQGKLWATPLLLTLLLIESSDVIFALDSIPAILAITTDSFIVYSSNAFAILGLRALYFLLASAIGKFVYLKPAVSAILIFVGIKMVISHFFSIPTEISLSVVGVLLLLGFLVSLGHQRRQESSGSK